MRSFFRENFFSGSFPSEMPISGSFPACMPGQDTCFSLSWPECRSAHSSGVPINTAFHFRIFAGVLLTPCQHMYCTRFLTSCQPIQNHFCYSYVLSFRSFQLLSSASYIHFVISNNIFVPVNRRLSVAWYF